MSNKNRHIVYSEDTHNEITSLFYCFYGGEYETILTICTSKPYAPITFDELYEGYHVVSDSKGIPTVYSPKEFHDDLIP